ncbi:MAG: hypothetical protein V4721_06490 [Bacteroidota bacterium]
MKAEQSFNPQEDKPKKELPEIHPNLSAAEFLSDWEKQYGEFNNPLYAKRFYYQAPKTSLNAKFSSRGWKMHVQFKKGYEKQLAGLLNTYGQYFKIEGEIGTYFNGMIDSGATIYVGPRENLNKLLALIEEKCPSITTADNYATTVFGKEVYGGSGSDEPVGRGLGARFDVQKSEFKDKYSEYGFATGLEFRGLPVLKKHSARVRVLEDIMKGTESQEKLTEAYRELQELFTETEKEVLKDFGADFVYGTGER